eukprot:TRINITY_DN3405_c0_g1_i2.p1 TRINITY_DN3405_c0_g1~~TRINITY_DN3405_c0_g1_i2.p1  ORF type:complete len:118 (+),score=20.23 TRINITY_DN3405_c0_g1_i2:164-517(+)
MAFIVLNLDADFTPCFHWNVKEIFVDVKIEYETEAKERNEFVLWDSVLYQKYESQSKHIKLSGISSKYTLTEMFTTLAGLDAKIVLEYHVLPYVGVLKSGRYPVTIDLTMPRDVLMV